MQKLPAVAKLEAVVNGYGAAVSYYSGDSSRLLRGSGTSMNTLRCWCDHGFVAGLLALLVLAASLSQVPARPGRSVPFSTPSSVHDGRHASVLQSPDTPQADAVLPVAAELSIFLPERLWTEEPPGTFEAGMQALPASMLRLSPAGARRVPFVPGVTLARHVFLHVFRC